MTPTDHVHSAKRRQGAYLALALTLLLSLGGFIGAAPHPAAAQYGPEPDTPPFIMVYRHTCPDDIGIGDDLSARCDLTADDEITIDGGVPSQSASLTGGFAEFDDLLADETYTITSDAIGSDRVSVIGCNTGNRPGFGATPGVPVTFGSDSGSFTVDLVIPRPNGGVSAVCNWFDLPIDGAVERPAALIVNDDAPSTTGGYDHRDLSLTGAALDEPLAIDTSNPNGVPAGPIVTGPILVPAGDYVFEDAIGGYATDLTLAPGEILTPDVTAGEPTAPETPEPGATIGFPGTNLAGAWTDLDSDLYGDEAGALYGAGSGNARGILTFDAPAPDSTADATITLLGLDDELPAAAQISVAVNGTELFDGDSTFPAWDPDATGNQWGELTLDIPNDLLADTDNDLMITNRSPGGVVGTPPWVMITRITIAQ